MGVPHFRLECSIVKGAVLLFGLAALAFDEPPKDGKLRANRLPASCEAVMSPGMRITAATSEGTISITAVDEITRAYTWDGATRALEMKAHRARYFGSLGLYHDGADHHWREHQGITRCCAAEGQQDNKTIEEAIKWIKERERLPSVYRNDGLMVAWYKELAGNLLRVEVWQILINGKKPHRLPGSQDDKIVVETVETESAPLVKAVGSNDFTAVVALLAKGADANVKSSVGIPVLLTAIRHCSAPIVEALLRGRADPNVRNVDTDFTPLLEAFNRNKSDRIDIVRTLLAAGADVDGASRKEEDILKGMTPLMLAAGDGDLDLVQLLLDKGANVNLKARFGITALSLATQSGAQNSKAVIRKLDAAGGKK
jgi:hypothetical protein